MLCELPHEIVYEIASYLPYKDIVVLSKALARKDVLNAHVVWYNLANQYLDEHRHSHFSNTSCLSSFTTDQLRQQFERRLLVNEIWQLPREVYPLVKRLKYPPSTRLRAVKIAPGGRWVFGGAHNLLVCYWDMDSDNPEPCVLIPRGGVDGIPERHCCVVNMDFVVKQSDPLSSFIIAFVAYDFDICYHGESREWLYIWEINVLESGTLKAKHLKALHMPYAGPLPQLSINEHLLVRYTQNRFDIYWWKDCTETHLTRCTLVFEKRDLVTNIYVLGKDKLLVYTEHVDCEHKARLYVLKPVYSGINEYQKLLPTTTKMWSLRFLCHHRRNEISKLYFDGTNYCQTIATLDGIFRLTIPACPANKPTFTRVSNFDLYVRQYEGRLYALGLNKGYCQMEQTLYRFGFSTGSTIGAYDIAAKVDPELDRILRRLDTYQSFDEESGRLITKCKNHLVLQDFALPVYDVANSYPSPDPVLEKDIPSWFNKLP